MHLSTYSARVTVSCIEQQCKSMSVERGPAVCNSMQQYRSQKDPTEWHSTVQHNVAQHDIAQHITAQHCTAKRSSSQAQRGMARHDITQLNFSKYCFRSQKQICTNNRLASSLQAI